MLPKPGCTGSACRTRVPRSGGKASIGVSDITPISGKLHVAASSYEHGVVVDSVRGGGIVLQVGRRQPASVQLQGTHAEHAGHGKPLEMGVDARPLWRDNQYSTRVFLRYLAIHTGAFAAKPTIACKEV